MGIFRRRWLRYSIDRKVRTFAFFVGLTVTAAVGFSILTMNFSLHGYGDILAANLSCQEFLDAMSSEEGAFRQYVEGRTEEGRRQLLEAERRTGRAIGRLPYDYAVIGAERYSRTWTILNSYPVYQTAREELLGMLNGQSGYIERLYQVYRMQDYLDTYGRRLLQATVSEGSQSYVRKLPFFRSLPFLLLNLTLLIGIIVLSISRLMSESLVEPVKVLSEEAKRITENDFYSPDIRIENQDEIGELVETFNIMKHSMGNYIGTLKENHRMTELLQKEQMENLAMEKRLEANRMELLRSQINPHFLFNTLNMIGSMADLEGAESTERMTRSLASLFRYNLSTREQIVPLSQELQVAEDYMYLQKMRFGSRVQYETYLPSETGDLYIPSFTLQPLIENAIVHGIARKEQGGRIVLRVRRTAGGLRLFLTDNGLGMSEQRRAELFSALDQERPSFETRVGIGLGNIYLRVKRLYPEGEFRIYSRENVGTSIVITIRKEEAYVSGIDCR